MPQKRREWSDADDNAIRDGHAAGESQRQIAETIGCTQPEVSRRARWLGIIWTQTVQTEAMAAVNRVKSAQARARLAELSIADAVVMHERMHEPHEVIVSTPAGPMPVTLDVPDAKATAEFAAAMERLVKVHENLTRMNSGSDSDAAKSMLNTLMEQARALIEGADSGGD